MELITESIQNFENKREFREVKLSTKKSFREDQAALEARLKKYRSDSTSSSDRNMSDKTLTIGVITDEDAGKFFEAVKHIDGQVVECENDVLIDSGYGEGADSQVGIDNVVLDLSDEKDEPRASSTDDNVEIGDSRNGKEKGSNDSAVETIELSEKSEQQKSKRETDSSNTPNNLAQNAEISFTLQQSNEPQPVQTTHIETQISGEQVQHVKQNGNGVISNGHGVVPNAHVLIQNGQRVDQTGHVLIQNGQRVNPNGHVLIQNGQRVVQNGHAVMPNNGYSSLIARPKVEVVGHHHHHHQQQQHQQQQRHYQNGSITPEPQIKLLRGIYQKNPKLTAGSTDHLDTLSLKSFRSG